MATLNGPLIYKFPYSKLLGDRPCGKLPTSQAWISYGAKANTPVYANAPNESCLTEKSCTPHPRFKDGDNDLAISRVFLRQANNRHFSIDGNGVPITPINTNIQIVRGNTLNNHYGAQTPFRALMNAGDPLMSNNKYAGTQQGWNSNGESPDRVYYNEPNQVSSTRRAANGAAVRMSGYLPKANNYGSSTSGGSEVSAWSGNQKWVYDGSDYVKFKKLQAQNRNFNDITFGGDRNNASQVPRSRVRH